MNSYTKLPKKQLYSILFSVALVILVASLEVLIKVKDISLFNAWSVQIENMDGNLFDLYVSSQMSQYFTKIIIPMLFGVYTYFAYSKIRINSLFVFMWSILIVGSLGYSISDFNYHSVFFYGFLIGYTVMLITVLSLIQVIQDHKSK
ncbi:hypothetical protein [Fusibacter tunisiensis]|uniref:Uncharacterized protein n=1 Tax=Fusibacter tunisiensis TaxID=1008308 RepID=A0ABS2MN08_9FIRM|nr:hypothetical protein [Fusibacter tunisiensis]MBM7560790.1 hypothetical protein [Fusibacter tunisiensis]